MTKNKGEQTCNRMLYMLLLFIITQSAFAQSNKNLELTSGFIDSQLRFSSQQIRHLEKNTPENQFPKTYENGENKHSNSSWWCSGFYPGTLLYLYEGTGDKELLGYATKKLKHLEQEKHNKRTHDLGFMLYCSFGNALRLTGDSASYKEILMTGANSLASRYHDKPQAIKSWDWGKWHYAVIIDNMMNLEFLTQASKISGDPKYREIAITHANTTIRNHFRPDYSSYHVVDYDEHTGNIVAKKTHQGAFDESAWSRGQGWALYGYVMMFRETSKKEYLQQAINIAEYILNHPNLPEDLIPYWDFDKDQLTEDNKMYAYRDLRDVSAAALYASALLELSLYADDWDKGKIYLKKAEKILQNLSSPVYQAKLGENGGYILKHSVGALLLNSEVDVPLTYADYYYVEALVRYQRLLAGEPIIKY